MVPARRHGPLACILLGALLLSACAGTPPRDSSAGADRQAVAIGERISAAALELLGRPYRYGGNGPDGFDCSGLVRFVHAGLGIDVPRTTSDQFAAARPVPVAKVTAGDLLFFRFEGPKVSHVAIYAGNGRFVHAPQTGRPVEVRPLDDWYRRRLVGAGRLYE